MKTIVVRKKITAITMITVDENDLGEGETVRDVIVEKAMHGRPDWQHEIQSYEVGETVEPEKKP